MNIVNTHLTGTTNCKSVYKFTSQIDEESFGHRSIGSTTFSDYMDLKKVFIGT